MARVPTDDLERLMHHNVHVATKTIYMGSEEVDIDGNESGTDAAMAARMIKALHHLDSATDPEKPITIIMNNLGGDVQHGMAIYDAIKACKSEVIIKVFGHAMSMGSIILQAADKRVMSPNSKVMIHYGTDGAYGHPKIAQRWMDEAKKYNKWMLELYLEKIREKHPDFTKKQIDKLLDFDTIYSANKAVEMGLADEVLE